MNSFSPGRSVNDGGSLRCLRWINVPFMSRMTRRDCGVGRLLGGPDACFRYFADGFGAGGGGVGERAFCASIGGPSPINASPTGMGELGRGMPAVFCNG